MPVETPTLPPAPPSGSTPGDGLSDLEARFQSLAERWRRETLLSSSGTEIVLHPAYQRIIGMDRPYCP